MFQQYMNDDMNCDGLNSLNEFTTDARYVIREFCIIGKEGRPRTTIVWVKMI